MSKARRKGTGYENHLRDTYLQDIWPGADRAPLRGSNDHGDFDNVGGYVVEAKKRDRWALPDWIRVTQKKLRPGDRPDGWMIWFAGNKTRGVVRDDYVLMPASLATHLLRSEQVAQEYT